METTPNQVYLNTAACGLLPSATIAAATKLYEEMAANSSTRSETWRTDEEPRIRQAIATFLNAPAANIAMIPNFSWGMNGIVQSLKGTEKVLLYRQDYPSLLEPFKINHFNITWVEAPDGYNIPIDQVKEAIINHQVDIVALSHVQWQSGYKIDLQEIGGLCKQHGILFFVDATQSMGALPINLSTLHIDVFASSNYKWMNAAFGTGVMYIAGGFLEKYPPVVGGNNSYKPVGDKLMYIPSAQSYEPGHPNMFGLTVLEAAIKHKLELGLGNIEAHNRQLTQLLLDNLKDMPLIHLGDYSTANRAPIVFLKDEDGLGDWLRQHNIVVTHRNGYLRISMHYYNTEADVKALIDCLKAKFK